MINQTIYGLLISLILLFILIQILFQPRQSLFKFLLCMGIHHLLINISRMMTFLIFRQQLYLSPQLFLHSHVFFSEFIIFLFNSDMMLNLLAWIFMAYQFIIFPMSFFKFYFQSSLLFTVEFKSLDQISELKFSLGELVP